MNVKPWLIKSAAGGLAVVVASYARTKLGSVFAMLPTLPQYVELFIIGALAFLLIEWTATKTRLY